LVHIVDENRNVLWRENLGSDLSASKNLLESTAFYSDTDIFFRDADHDGDPEVVLRSLSLIGQSLLYYVNHSENFVFLGGPGDFDADGSVNVLDLSIFLAYYGSSCPEDDENCLPDLVIDGLITVQDLARFLSLYGTVYCE